MKKQNIFKKTANFIAQQKWLVKHAFAATIAVLLTLAFRWLVKNWGKEIVICEVRKISVFLDSNLHFIEPLLTLIIFMLFAILGRVIIHYQKGSMAKASGMFFYSPNLKERQVNKSEKFLRQEANKCVHIHILGASGWNTFGYPDSPLYEGLQRCGEAQIILLNPLSPAINQRAKDIGQEIEDYKKEIIMSLKYIRKLILKGDNQNRIQVKMYSSYPGWKLVILGRYIWMQWYPNDDHVRDSPCYAFQSDIDENRSIYSQLFAQFKKRWESYKLGQYNFKNETLEFYDKDGQLIKETPIPI